MSDLKFQLFCNHYLSHCAFRSINFEAFKNKMLNLDLAPTSAPTPGPGQPTLAPTISPTRAPISPSLMPTSAPSVGSGWFSLSQYVLKSCNGTVEIVEGYPTGICQQVSFLYLRLFQSYFP